MKDLVPSVTDGCEDGIILLETVDSTPSYTPKSSLEAGSTQAYKSARSAWKILIIDQNPKMHHSICTGLHQFQFEQLPVQILSAHSAKEGQAILLGCNDIAVVLLEIPHNSSQVDLQAIQAVCNAIGQNQARMILCVAHPEDLSNIIQTSPPSIHDYQLKSDLNHQRLLNVITLALRSYQDSVTIEKQRLELEASRSQLLLAQEELKRAAQTFELQVNQETAVLRHRNAELCRLVALDGLTQVANRRRFDEYLQEQWQSLTQDQQPLSLILLDVDYFKGYNDRYGHCAGDRCLQQLAQAIQACAARPLDLVARYGGEEFAVLLPQTSIQGAKKVAQTILAAVNQLALHNEASQVSDRVTLSAGLSWVIPQIDIPATSLIETADRALYRAKFCGRNSIETYAA